MTITDRRGTTVPSLALSDAANWADNALARYDAVTGLLQKCAILCDDSGNLTPTSNDNSSLGTNLLGWGNVYIAADGTLDFGAGDIILSNPATDKLLMTGGRMGWNCTSGQMTQSYTMGPTEASGVADTRLTIFSDGSGTTRADVTLSNDVHHVTMAFGDSGVGALGERWGIALSTSGIYGIVMEHGAANGAGARDGYIGILVGATSALNPLTVGATEAPAVTGAMIGVYNAGVSYQILRNTTDNIEAIIGCTATSAILGTSTNHGLLFRGNGTDFASMSAVGNWALDTSGTTKSLSGLSVLAGGSAVSSTLQVRSTTGNGSSDAIIFQVGNNGATEAARFNTSGQFGIGVTPTTQLHVSKASVGATVVFTLANTDNTNAASHARIDIANGGSSGGDPFINFGATGETSWQIGVDNSDSNNFKITNNGSIGLGTGDRFIIDGNGLPIWLPITTTPATLGTNGMITMTLTSNTNLRFSGRGTDGTTRVANVTLA